MGTRGYLGLKKNGKIIEGRYNSHDSYYSNLGKEVINLYFNGEGKEILGLTEACDNDIEFIYNGLFCEYGYIYNQDNDTLEIYRGFFNEPQFKGHKGTISYDKTPYFCHLIFVVDRKKYTKEQVLRTFEEYDNSPEDTDELREIVLEKLNKKDLILYPERKIIPFKFEDKYKF